MNFPYKVERMDPGGDIWWPVSSDPENNMVVGDGIPGDKKTAEFAARCCNIAYKSAVDDVLKAIKDSLPDERRIREKLGTLSVNK